MKVRNLLGLTEEVEQEQPVPELVLPRNAIGLEYEWERTGAYVQIPEGSVLSQYVQESSPTYPFIYDVTKYFNVHIDHSLRKEGKEFTFKGPYRGSKILRAVTAMDNCSRALNFEGTYRTSLHVHLDMSDLTFPDDIIQFGGVYSVVEAYLYQFVGHNRFASNYCVPWYKHPQHYEAFLLCVQRYHKPGTQNILPSLKNGKSNKYAGLNCFSLGDFGTVEFRQAPVTMASTRIITWINIIMHLKQWTLQNPMNMRSLIRHVTQTRPEVFLTDVFKSHFYDVVRLSKNLEADYWNGIETLYQYAAI